MMLKRLGTALAMIVLGASPSFAAGVSLFPSTTPLEPSQIQATLNGLIISMNTAFAAQGTGVISNAITIPSVTSPVNLLSITAGATGTGVALGVGGPGVDTNAGISLAGVGTGATLIGGTTTTLAGLQVAQPVSRVNDVLITPGATAVVPIITSATAGADANIGIILDANGTGSVYLNGTTAATAAVSVAQGTANVNQIILTGTNTGTVPGITLGGATADANRDLNIAANGTGIVTLGAARATCSGTTTATCTGQRFTASITGLTTAAGGVSATAMTVTNTNVVASTSLVTCNVNGYSGTGQPIATNVTPGTGSVSFQVTNIASSGSLNATVPVACVVF